MDDEAFYAIVARELAVGDVRPGLWAKAYAEANGDKAATNAAYIRLRVRQLKKEVRETEQRERKHKKPFHEPQELPPQPMHVRVCPECGFQAVRGHFGCPKCHASLVGAEELTIWPESAQGLTRRGNGG